MTTKMKCKSSRLHRNIHLQLKRIAKLCNANKEKQPNKQKAFTSVDCGCVSGNIGLGLVHYFLCVIVCSLCHLCIIGLSLYFFKKL